MANAFVEELKFEGELFTDPELHSYKALNFKVIFRIPFQNEIGFRTKLITTMYTNENLIRKQADSVYYSLLACGRRPSQLLRRVSVKVRFRNKFQPRSRLLIANSVAKTQGEGNQLGGVLVVEPEDHVSRIHPSKDSQKTPSFRLNISETHNRLSKI